jgi:hypothetical protein
MRCEHRGPILIHAGKTLDLEFDELRRVLREGDIHVPPRKALARGGVMGRATARGGSGFSICERAALAGCGAGRVWHSRLRPIGIRSPRDGGRWDGRRGDGQAKSGE